MISDTDAEIQVHGDTHKPRWIIFSMGGWDADDFKNSKKGRRALQDQSTSSPHKMSRFRLA